MLKGTQARIDDWQGDAVFSLTAVNYRAARHQHGGALLRSHRRDAFRTPDGDCRVILLLIGKLPSPCPLRHEDGRETP